MDKESIWIQFAAVTPEDVLTFEPVIFPGTCHVRGNQCNRSFFNTVEEQLLLPSNNNMTRVMLTFQTNVGFKFSVTLQITEHILTIK